MFHMSQWLLTAAQCQPHQWFSMVTTHVNCTRHGTRAWAAPTPSVRTWSSLSSTTWDCTRARLRQVVTMSEISEYLHLPLLSTLDWKKSWGCDFGSPCTPYCPCCPCWCCCHVTHIWTHTWSWWAAVAERRGYYQYFIKCCCYYYSVLIVLWSQVYEMLHCARECSVRDSDNHITFGEFCVFATELRRYYSNHEKDPNTVQSLPIQVIIT